jgi:hypothetical protein
MKLRPTLDPTLSRRRRGSAVMIVLILLSVMGVLLLSNTVTLRRLKVELQLLEQKQKHAWEQRAQDR